MWDAALRFLDKMTFLPKSQLSFPFYLRIYKFMKTILSRILAIVLIPALELAASVPAVSTASARDAYAAGSNLVYLPLIQSPHFLKWNTFLGSPKDDYAHSIAVDGSGNVYVAGQSNAT